MITQIATIINKKPELALLVKKAESWDNFPCEDVAQTFFSAILSGYLEKTAAVPVPEHVKRAVKVRNLSQPSIDEMVSSLVKNHLPQEVETADEHLKAAEHLLMEKTAAEVREFSEYYNYTFTDPTLKIRAGQEPIYKQAVLEAIEARRAAMDVPVFDPVFAEIEKCAESIIGQPANKILDLMKDLDDKVGYTQMGFNFEKDAARRSDLLVDMGERKVPIESIIPRIGAISKIGGEPLKTNNLPELKAVLESLPRDLKRLALRYV